MTLSIFPVILCGGAGSRLWPMSRQLLPKQFLPLLSERTMIEVQSGGYLGEDDIVRFEDAYKRV